MSASYADNEAFTSRVPAVFGTALTSAQITAALDDARAFVSLSAYRGKALLAHVYYTAHILVCRFETELGVAGGGDTPGPVTSMSAGEISASFAVATPDEGSPASTKWGRKFLEVSKFVPHEFLAVY